MDEARSPGAAIAVVALTWLARALLLLPTTWLACLFAIVLRARLELGYWPYARTGNPFDGTLDYPMDPKVMPIHHGIIIVLMPLAMLSFLGAPAAGFLAVANRALPRAKAWFLLHILSSIGMAYLLVADPGGFLLWFAD